MEIGDEQPAADHPWHDRGHGFDRVCRDECQTEEIMEKENSRQISLRTKIAWTGTGRRTEYAKSS
jgi:hypothetical protein